MCQSGLHIKFCTCPGDVLLNYPRWELWRPEAETERWDIQAVGDFMPPALESELLLDRVLQDLNRADAFDADIEFLQKDKLIVRWNEDDALMFRYDGRKWSSLSAWGMEDLDFRALLKKGLIEARTD